MSMFSKKNVHDKLRHHGFDIMNDLRDQIVHPIHLQMADGLHTSMFGPRHDDMKHVVSRGTKEELKQDRIEPEEPKEPRISFKARHVKSFFSLGFGVESMNLLHDELRPQRLYRHYNAKIFLGPFVILINVRGRRLPRQEKKLGL
jgi:hypothetical protein